MKNRIFMTIAMLLVASGLLLPATAQKPSGDNGPQLHPKNLPVSQLTFKVPIKCYMGGGDVLAQVLAFNDTGETIKKGKVIYYFINAGGNNSFTLDADLLVGHGTTIGYSHYPFVCQAWFFK
jgi:hypothetical protein